MSRNKRRLRRSQISEFGFAGHQPKLAGHKLVEPRIYSLVCRRPHDNHQLTQIEPLSSCALECKEFNCFHVKQSCRPRLVNNQWAQRRHASAKSHSWSRTLERPDTCWYATSITMHTNAQETEKRRYRPKPLARKSYLSTLESSNGD
jgi:hypothetical protein